MKSFVLFTLLVGLAGLAGLAGCSRTPTSVIEAAPAPAQTAPATVPFTPEQKQDHTAEKKAEKAEEPIAEKKEKKEIGDNKETIPIATAASLPKVPVASLRRDLLSDNDSTVDEAVLQLSRRPDAVPEILEMFATGNVYLKRLAWSCLKTMGEPARLQLNEIVANPSSWEPQIIGAAREILIKGFRQGLTPEYSQTPPVAAVKEEPKSHP